MEGDFLALIFIFSYQHSDVGLLQPVANELARRGHNIMSDHSGYHAFLSSHGQKALLMVSDYATFEHAEGQSAVKQARWKNVPSFSIQHGIPFSKMDNRTTIGTHTAAHTFFWGEHWIDYFLYNDSIVTGNPALDIALHYDFATAFHRVRQITTGPVALLCPQFEQNLTNKALEWQTIDERRDTFIEAAHEQDFPGTWLVRPHPSALKRPDHLQAAQEIATELGGLLQSPDDGVPLYDLLATCDLVCGMSTVLYEALAFRCEIAPVGMDALHNNFDDLFDGMASWRIASEIERLINA